MTGSRNFLLALAAAIIAPFAVVLLLPGTLPAPQGIAAAEAAAPTQAGATSAPSAFSTTQAVDHLGESATIEGVAHVHIARSGSATFVDLDGVYPDSPFSAVIFEDDMANVGDVSDLEGKTVDVTGKIRMYRGRPEIIVSSRGQLAAR